MRRRCRLAAVCLSITLFSARFPLFAASVPPIGDNLYAGWLKMYNLRFADAHQQIESWEQAHPLDPMGPVSEAAAYLFSEFARLGVLESELFVEDKIFQHRKKLDVDPETRRHFEQDLDRADSLATAALASSAADLHALMAKSFELGLRADCAAMIDKQSLLPLKYTKQSREYAERLLAADATNFDAYLGPGIENYLLSLEPAPLRFFLELAGSKADRQAGVAELKMTAQHGHFLEPFAKLLLAVAALRDKNPAGAESILLELQRRFPENPLYDKEIRQIRSQTASKR